MGRDQLLQGGVSAAGIQRQRCRRKGRPRLLSCLGVLQDQVELLGEAALHAKAALPLLEALEGDDGRCRCTCLLHLLYKRTRRPSLTAASSGGMSVCTHGWLSTSAAVMRCPGSTVSIF